MYKIFTLFFLASLLSFVAFAQHGVDPAWSADVELPVPSGSSSTRGFLYSNIGVFSNGKRVVFLSNTDNPGDPVYYTYSYDGQNWSTPQPFAAVSLVIGLNSPKIMVDHNDKLHVVWNSKAPQALFYSQMDSALNVVIDSARISDQPMYGIYNGVYPSIDRKNRLHVMWHEGKVGSDVTEVFYSRSLDGGLTWSPRDSLSVHDGLSSAFPRGQYNAYGGDSLAILWRDTSTVRSDDWDIHMVVSQDGGATWSTPVVINKSSAFQGDPDLVIDPQGRFHLFYHEAPASDPYWGIRIMYGYSGDLGITWQPSATFTPVSNDQRSYLAEGSRYDIQNNVLWTFWKEEDLLGLKGGDMMAAYSTDRGLNWSTPEYVTDRGETSIGFKAVALLPNGGLAVNYELPNYPATGQVRVFYKERQPLDLVTGLNSDILLANPAIYPNPARDWLTVDLAGLSAREIILMTATGRVIRSRDTLGQAGPVQFNLQGMTSGLYLLKIVYTNRIVTAKVIKQ